MCLPKAGDNVMRVVPVNIYCALRGYNHARAEAEEIYKVDPRFSI